jgi:hypothetical protein
MDFRLAVENLKIFSPRADIFVLLHKMDLVPL